MSKIQRIYENIKANNQNLQDEVHLFFNLMLRSDFEEITESRFTSIFIIKLFYAFIRGAHLNSIFSEIRNLEKPYEGYIRMKPPTQFKKEPLKGLWHKHFEQIGMRSMALNMRSQINLDPNFSKEFSEIYNNEYISLNEKVKQLGYLSTTKQYLNRIDNGMLTGEWIIYHIHNNKNFYLNVCKHNDGDLIIANEIKEISLFEFPDFKDELPIFK